MIRARIRLDEKRYGEKPKRPQPWTPEQLKRYREEEAADREQLREQQRADEADQVCFRTVLKRCPAIAELFIQAKKSPERSRTRADLMGATNVHYSVECRIALLDRLIDRLRRLVGPAANSSDPLLARHFKSLRADSTLSYTHPRLRSGMNKRDQFIVNLKLGLIALMRERIWIMSNVFVQRQLSH